jgi:two-component system NarL family sensor kinase
MTFVKDKYLDILGQSLQTLSVSSISPQTNSSKLSSQKNSLPVIDSHHIVGLSELLGFTQPPTNRMSVEEEEKKRISRELHDGLGQLLTSMNMHIQRCLNGYQGQDVGSVEQDEHKQSLHTLSSMVKQAMNEVRTICSAIRPAILDDLGVVAAVVWQCRQISQISTSFEVVPEISVEESDIDDELKTVIYRIVQESLNNALKYSKATKVEVTLSHAHNAIRLIIRDNGIGFDPTEIQDRLGMGLMSMRERAELVNGALEVNAAVDKGVEVSANFATKRVTLNG